MSTELKLPNLGENVDSGDVIKVLVSIGDRIAAQQPIVELETDKAIVEVPAESAGVVEKIHVQAGDKLAVGQLILTLSDGAAIQKKESAAKPARKKAAKEGTPDRGKAPAKEKVEASAEDRKASVVDFARRQPAEEAAEARGVVPASPSVRRLAREIGVDIHQVQGSGPQGRISIDDVKAYSRSSRLAEPRAVPTTVGPASLPDFSRWGEVETVPFSNVRRKTAEHMARSWASVPHVTQHDECEITNLERLRRQHGPKVEAAGGKLTMTAILLKVAAAALRVFPQVNASIDTAREEIILKKYIHIGIAVDTPRGLLVPVIRDVDQKNILQLSVELKEVAERTRAGKVSLEELQGGTFTITNLGGIGGTSFTPIVNWPEAAILGVSRAKVRAAFENGSVVPATFLPLSLSYDHRLIDGADAARFVRWIAQALEDPFLVSLEG